MDKIAAPPGREARNDRDGERIATASASQKPLNEVKILPQPFRSYKVRFVIALVEAIYPHPASRRGGVNEFTVPDINPHMIYSPASPRAEENEVARL